jgi:CheY-like chemotaxis protein
MGLRVHVARDGKQALDYIDHTLPQGIILDLMMPGINGFQVLEAIRGTEKTQDIPVIAVTAQAMRGDKERILDSGCDDYMAKPIDPETILIKIEKWL